MNFIEQKFDTLLLRESRPELNVNNISVVDPVLLHDIEYYVDMMKIPKIEIPANFKFQYFTNQSKHDFIVNADDSFIVMNGEKRLIA